MVSEFVVIVLGVLVALAVDNWSQERQDNKTKAHLIQSLLSDLREDRGDYQGFVEDCNARHAAANFINALVANRSERTDADYENAREALRRLGSTSRIETVESTFREMSSLGSAATIGDDELRIRISHYYGLARDRADLNEFLWSGILRYRGSLEEVGVSFVDQEQMDVDAVLNNKKSLAIIRELGVLANFAGSIVADLQEENSDLIATLEALQEE